MAGRAFVVSLLCWVAICGGGPAGAANPCGNPTDPGDKDCLAPRSYGAEAYPAVTNPAVSGLAGGHVMQFLNPARFGAGTFIFGSAAATGAADGATFTQSQWFQPNAGGPTDGLGSFVKSGDTASLTGTLLAGRQLAPGRFGLKQTGAVRVDDADKLFAVDLRFAYRGDGLGNDGKPGPLRELFAGAYVGNGGTIDPNDWSYFDLIGGQLTGKGLYAGLVLELYQLDYRFQSGVGANGRNFDLGLSAGFGYAVAALDTKNNRFLGDLAGSQGLFVGWDSLADGGRLDRGSFNIDWDIVAVDEPAGAALLALGVAALLAARRRLRPAGAGPAVR